MNIYEKLMNIQTELKCQKGQYNSFGKYKYRSCEDILTSVKPFLQKYKLILTSTDEVVMIGTRFYVKATVILIDTESKDKELSNLTCTAYAREDEIKKGMDGSQITGASSSYARKYALNGLLAIDDTKDADTDEYTEKAKDVYDRNYYLQIIKEKFTDEQKIIKICEHYNVKSLDVLTDDNIKDFVKLSQEG